ncbi:MAG: dockerin type I domain-containing protein [Saprospiraceae bacterium]|nr:dockerin type I domain-containing protein [Saprospiraceae bacterium]
MNKLIQHTKSQTSQSLVQIARSMGIVFCLFVANMTLAQVDCNTTMACNDGLQVSLDDNCEALITPDMILEDPAYDNSAYTVELMDSQGNTLPNATVDYSYVNQTLSVNVSLNGCASSCWGSITIEDKLPPVFSTCLDYELDCDADITPGAGFIPFPTLIDACSNNNDLDYFDEVVSNACAASYVKTITRYWTATDEQGNEAECVQTINILKASIMDIVWPPNYDDLDQPAFSCAVTIETLPNGAPTPAVTGEPSGANCPNIQTYYTDIIFDICGASKKILRQWVVVDWCTGEEATFNQIIKILDTAAPICTSNSDFLNEIFTDEGECTGTFEVPAPIIIFECSDYTYNVGYKLRDENGDPFENPIYDNITYDPTTGLYTIYELPQDTSWIVYTITDACDNSTQCFTEVIVMDGEAPTPVCEGYTVVGLEDEGWADIFATSIDDGSFDNCAIDRYEVKRLSTNCGFPSDLQFGEKVNFCCEDVNAGYIKVVLRVYDKADNYNDCVVNVNVQDKINPTIECPDNLFIQCTQDYEDLSLTGEAVGDDNCSVEVTFTDQVNLNDCGIGTVRRTWRATDPQGRTASCIQIITVGDNNPFNENNISWPSDREVNGCNAENITPEDLNSFPILSNTDCSNIAISYDDNVFYNTPEYCIKVLRHWKIIDWCNYDPQNPSYYAYTQKIGVFNTVAPTFTNCSNQSFISEDGDCQETVDLRVDATDDCTAADDLEYTYEIDVDSDGSVEYNGTGNTVTRTLESGVHTVKWTVTDECDNVSNCTQIITVQDNKAPTPICLGEVVWVLGEDGSAEVWASDFDLKSFDSCDDDDDLVFAFNAAGTQQALTFDCGDIPNGIAEEINLQMYVFDTDGNYEFCDVVLILQDSESSNACTDNLEGNKATIAGSITTHSSEGLMNIEVQLMNMDEQDAEMEMTENSGLYAFEDVEYYDVYAVEPYKNDDATNGVSTLDLVMIQRHILGLAELDSPYKLIAADVNGNNKITSSDLLMMRKVILGIQENFGDNTSWRFIPTTHEIEEPTNPFDFPEKVIINELYVSDEHIDFTAIKIGDVNGNANPGLVSNEDLSNTRAGAKMLSIDNQILSSNEKVTVPVYANEVDDLTGLQLTVELGADVRFSGIQSNALEISDDNYKVENNIVTLSWNVVNGIAMNENDILFSIELEVVRDGELASNIEFTSNLLDAEVYDHSLKSFDLGLEILDRSLDTAIETKLHQNVPNPFKGMTTIGFDLKEGGLATLAIFDITGKELYRISNEFNKGKNAITLDVESLNANSGILYYTLKAGEFIDTKKMMIID